MSREITFFTINMNANNKYKYQVIDSAEEVQRILRDDANRPFSLAEQYRTLQHRFQLDFSASIRLLELLPVFLSGSKHKELRKEMAKMTAVLRPAQELAVKEYVCQLDQLLTPNVTIDLRNQFIKPLWRHLINIRGDYTDIEMGLIEDTSLLFNRDLSIVKRLAINNRLADYLSKADSAGDDSLIKLGGQVLGFVPLVESITISLHTIFKNNVGVSLNTISYPVEIPISAVPGTARWVGDVLVGCPLHSPGYSKEINQKLMFGSGLHSCLGAHISRFIWPEIIQRVALSPLIVDSTELHFLNPPNPNDELKSIGDRLIRDTVTRTENFKLTLRSA